MLNTQTRPKYRWAVVACARWEDRYIVEWLNYYRTIGFDHVFLYSNDDDPIGLYSKITSFLGGESPFVTFRHHANQGEQAQIYSDFLARDRADCEWISFFDIDEFLRLPAQQTIGQFLSRFDQSVDCVMFNMVYFGPNGHKTPPDGHVLETLLRREDDIHCLTKYCARADVFLSPKFHDFREEHWFWHTLHYITETPLKMVNVLGETMDGYFEGFPDRPTKHVNEPERKQRLLGTAIIHHYAFRSEQHFLERCERGLNGNFHRQKMWKEIYESTDFPVYLARVNAIQDQTLADFWKIHKSSIEPIDDLARPESSVNMKVACVAVVKDEANHISEWIAYQFAIGFDTVIILDNLSSDDTKQIARRFAKTHDIRVLDSIDTTETYQTSAYQDALGRFGCEFTWMAFFDADEYLVLNPDINLQDCLATHTHTAAIGINWAIFGASGHHEPPAGLTIESYKYRSAPDFGPNQHVKSIVRPEKVQAILNGHSFAVEGPYRTLSGRPIEWASPGITADAPNYEAGKLHHYFVRSWCDWRRKLSRGYPDLQRRLDDFLTYDRNDILDDSATRFVSDVMNIIEQSRHAETLRTVALENFAHNKAATQTSSHWQVDLGIAQTVSTINICDTSAETASKLKNFTIGISIDGDTWVEIAREENEHTISGTYTWGGPGRAWGRYVRVSAIDESNALSLDHVEIYDNDNIASSGDTTVVITSCNRHDLLEKTLASFVAYNTYTGIKEILVVEDGDADPSEICEKYGARLLRLGGRKGQLHAIDRAYAHVTTPYIFHCEDDWEFYRRGFMEKSKTILEVDASCVCVWLRAWSDTNGHPLSFHAPDKTFGALSYDYSDTWHGFTWNPGLRRKSDYKLVGPFSKEFNHKQDLKEPAVSILYRNLGYRALILDETGYVRHLGWERHVSS